MERPNLYRQTQHQLHTASDGQNSRYVETTACQPIIQYFGQGQGVSTYVTDGLMHNDVVKSDSHSTDPMATQRPSLL